MAPIINLILCALLQFCMCKNQSEIDKWRAYVNSGGLSIKKCSDYIPDDVQEAMIKSSGVIPSIYLYKCIFNNYIKDLSPIEGSDSTFNVSYAFAVNDILDILTEGAIYVSAQIFLMWNDQRLQWNTSAPVGNWSWPKLLKIPVNKLWMPIPEVLNCDKSDCAIKMPNSTSAYVYPNGSISVLYKSQAQSACDINLDYFPFDKQKCDLYIGIFNEVENYKWVLNHEFMRSYYMADHNEWTFSEFRINTTQYFYYYLEKNENFSKRKWLRSKIPWNEIDVINVTVIAYRSTSFYMTNLIIPLIIINLVATASVAFPSGAGERPNTLLTVLLAYCFFQSVLASVLPRTRNNSLISLYLMWAMVSCAAELLVSFVFIALNHKAEDGYVPPLLIRKYVIRYPRYLLNVLIHKCCCKNHKIEIVKSKHLQENNNQPNNENIKAIARNNERSNIEEENPITEGREESIVEVSGPTFKNLGKSIYSKQKYVMCPHQKPFVPRGEGWDNVADAFNWILGIIFVAINVVTFYKYLQPLLRCSLYHSLYVTNYFKDFN